MQTAASPLTESWSGNGRWGARLGVRADTNGRQSLCGLQPGYALVLALQSYENERWRNQRHRAASTGPAERTAISMRVLAFCGGGLPLVRRRHLLTDRRHIERVGRRIRNHAKCRDGRHQLHHHRQHHDRNEQFQSPSHDFPRAPTAFVSPSLIVVETLAAHRHPSTTSK